MTTRRQLPTVHAALRAIALPRFRALVQAFTSPRRVWFWTTTLPVVLAPVVLFLVMRPGVVFKRSVTVGGVVATVQKVDDPKNGRAAMADIQWRAGRSRVVCLVPISGHPVFENDLVSSHYGPLGWSSELGSKIFLLDAHSFGLGVEFRY